VAVVLFTTFIFIPAAKSTSTTRSTNSLDLEQKIKTRESIKDICTQLPRFICLFLEVLKLTHRLSLAQQRHDRFNSWKEEDLTEIVK
jgi:hypothetical protein